VIPTRVIPTLLLKGDGLVKTVRFKKPTYLGDPRNTVRIFNDKEVDELVLLDITATPLGQAPRLELIREIVDEAFMPVAYGGGIVTAEQALEILALGVEKIVLCTSAVTRPELITEIADAVGSQSVVVAVDAKRTFLGRYEAFVNGGRTRSRKRPDELAQEAVARGAGEVIINSIDRDGQMVGYDVPLIRSVTEVLDVPVVALGGAGALDHFTEAVNVGKAAAVAAGSFFVFQGPHRAVLITYPSPDAIREALPVREAPRLMG